MRGTRGFTLIEVLVATLLLAGGLLGTAMAVDGARDLSAVSERTSSLTHRAEEEIERIRALGYGAIALRALPVRSADPADPSAVLTAGDPPALRPDRHSPAAEPLVVDGERGRVDATPRPWSDGRLRGTVRAYVSWHRDPYCGSGCPDARNAKRITVAVTVEGRDRARRGPVWLSTLVADPNAAPAGFVADGVRNPVEDPETRCLPDDGPAVPCTRSIGGASAASWFLYDTPAPRGAWEPTAGDHDTHPTVAPFGVCSGLTAALAAGCPVPDLLGPEPTPADPTAPADPGPLPDRSRDQPGSAGSGGRILRRDVACSASPTADNRRGQRWVSPLLEEDAVLTGRGGITLYGRTAGGVPAAVTVCVRFSAVPGSIVNLVERPPRPLGTISYALAAWPGVTTPVSFGFDLAGDDLRIPAGQRLGVQLWVAGSSADDLLVAYDHPTVPSSLQLQLR
ncbi:prepilin-type N-terminal cleavage/methylation domain-containing protein [Patulibacter defluvii]|uniref:prepilin-type N-terminal cleavage/methylation domain-containing protein n=1 Tax=Patulibacter defluvii TaxID=3095358 RepID=UPI002A760300|nr:prepilin-type N-terminal cleavage/methylation domain-containing protein [Patulibacter sp. DM4]